MREYFNIKTGGIPGWTAPSDWIDISNCANNEILMLATDGGSGLAFTIGMASGGTFSVDWGDGTTQVGIANNLTVSHTYNYIGGTPCSLGYNTYKVRVFNATNNITTFKFQKSITTSLYHLQPVLSINIGAKFITDYSATFYSTTYRCSLLKSCKISSFQNCTNATNLLSYCISLMEVFLPNSWGTVQWADYLLNGCTSLPYLILPNTWGNVSSAKFLCLNNYSLAYIKIPDTWGTLTDVSSFLFNCYKITSLKIPSDWGAVVYANDFCNGCISLEGLNLPLSWKNVQVISGLVSGCTNLLFLNIPASWGGILQYQNFLRNCYSLPKITLPAGHGPSGASYFFYNNYSIKSIQNIEYLGSIVDETEMSDFIVNCTQLTQDISIGAKLSIIGIYGSAGAGILPVTSIRLTNPNSQFSGSSPQINVSYTSLPNTALNTLFGDLPALAGKTIKITGAAGAATCNKSIATAKGWTVIG